jgi:hypothetical protein
MFYLEIYLIGFLIVMVGMKVFNYYFSKHSSDYLSLRFAFLAALLSWVYILLWTIVFVIVPTFEWIGSSLSKLGQAIKEDYEKLVLTSFAQRICIWFESTPYDEDLDKK